VDVVSKVFAMIKARPGKFLQKDDDGWWRESSDTDAIDKVRKTFLSARTKEKKDDIPAHAGPDDDDTDTAIFLQQGKRPRYDADGSQR
jgi:hypothetical protein